MSLTSFLKLGDVRKKFNRMFPMPYVSLDGEMLASPQTKHYALVGTSFDYLLRFYLETLNPGKTKNGAWIANYGEILARETPLGPLATRMLNAAKEEHGTYLRSGVVTTPLLKSTIHLAQLDQIYRSGSAPIDFGIVHDEDLRDLQKLLSIVKPSNFKVKNVCYLNPVFPNGVEIVGGADADLILDTTLVDIKTTMKLDFTQDYYNQLTGYYMFATMEDMPIDRMGIYFSRHGILKLVKPPEVGAKMGPLVEWMRKRARG